MQTEVPLRPGADPVLMASREHPVPAADGLSRRSPSTASAAAGRAAGRTAGRPRLAVVGAGDYGRAFATRATSSGYSVLLGSRNPGRK